MTAPSCSECSSVRYKWIEGEMRMLCGVPPKHRPDVTDQRAPDGPCGPKGDLFAPRQGEAA